MKTNANHIIEVIDGQNKIDITDLQIALVKAAAITALESENITHSCEIDIEFTDNATIRDINKEYRNKDAPTDVLSFPMLENRKLARLKEQSDSKSYLEFEDDINPENGAILLGDIIISAETAKEQSAEIGQSFERELAFLTVHAVLHLLGYDHEISEDSDIDMRKRQKVITARLFEKE